MMNEMITEIYIDNRETRINGVPEVVVRAWAAAAGIAGAFVPAEMASPPCDDKGQPL